jgi:hypothetical protein
MITNPCRLLSCAGVVVAVVVLIYGAFVAGTPSARGAAIISFDTAADLNQFSLNGNGSALYSFQATAGTGGGGGVKSTSTTPELDTAIHPAGSANTIGNNIFATIDFHYRIQPFQSDILLGFASASNGAFTDAANNIRLAIFGSFTDSVEEFAVIAGSSLTSFPNLTLVDGNWFRLRLDLTKTGAVAYSGIATLSNLGSSGLTAPVIISTQPFAITSTSLGSAAQLFPGFSISRETTGADNFGASSLVPEPATPAMVLLGVGALGCLARRSAQLRPHIHVQRGGRLCRKRQSGG